MQAWIKLPRFFRRKIAIVSLVGLLIACISAFIYLVSADQMQLILGCILFLACLGKAVTLWICAAGEHYHVLTGICMIPNRKSTFPMRRIAIRTKDGEELTVAVDRKLKIEGGKTYHFYFQGNPPNSENEAMAIQDAYQCTLIGIEPVLPEEPEDNHQLQNTAE